MAALNLSPMWIPFCLVSLFGLMGFVFVVLATSSRQAALISEDWPTVAGKVISSTILERHPADQGDTLAETVFEPVVEYSYTLQGNTYRGNAPADNHPLISRKRAERINAHYPPGAPLRLHYNPEKPSEAVLEAGAAIPVVFLVAGALMLVAAIMIACISTVTFLGA
jgi:hypothetical protein